MSDTGGARFALAVDGVMQVLDSPAALRLSEWNHVAGSYDGTTMRLYVDGIAVATLDIAGSVMDYIPATDLKIGVFADDNEGHYLDGKIADVRLWDTTRTADEIADNMSAFVASDSVGLVANWRLNDETGGTATTAVDATGNYDGAILGSPDYVSDPMPLASVDATINEDGVLIGNVIASDAEGDAITFSVASDGAPENGTLIVNADGTYKYTPVPDYYGMDSFTVKATTANGAFSTQTISVTINSTEDVPTILGASDAQNFVQLDGEDDYLQILDNGFDLDPGKGDFTFEAWIDLAALSGDQVLFDKRGGFGAGMHAFIDSSGYVNLEMGDGLQLNAGASSSGTVDADGWHHVAISVDRDGNAEFYIDGMLSGSEDVSATADLILSNSEPMLIGKSYADDNHMQGGIDEIRFWNEARSDLDIARNYASKIGNPASESTLTGYWNFDTIDTHDEGFAHDLSAQGNHLYAGDPLLDGEFDTASGESVDHLVRATEFNGSSSTVDLSANAAALSTGTGSFTYEAWIKTTAVSAGEILTIGSAGGNTATQFRTVADGGVKLQMSSSGDGPVSAATVNDGLWHHVAVSYDSSTGIATLFVDGETDASAAINPNLGASSAIIGANFNSSGIFFDGEIADVRIWDHARQPGEISDGRDYFPQPDEQGLLAHYKLDGADGATAVDSTGNGNDGTINSAVTVDVGPGVYQTEISINEDQSFSGRVGAFDADGSTTLSFAVQNSVATAQGGTVSVNADGEFSYIPPVGYLGADTFAVSVSDEDGNVATQTITINTTAYNDLPMLLGVAPTSGGIQFVENDADDSLDTRVIVPDDTALDFGTDDFTIESWVLDRSTDADYHMILDKRDASGNGYLAFLNPDNTIRFQIKSGGNNQNIDSTVTVPVDEWHHIAITVDRDTGVTFYVDGVKDETAGVQSLISTVDNESIDSAHDLVIGDSAVDASSVKAWTGQLDDIRLWREARTADEIAQNYQQRLDSGVDTTNLAGYWRFDQINEDGTASDLSGNGNDAVVGHGAPVDAFAPTLSFNGSTDEITTAAPPPVSGSHTVEAWYKTTATGTVAIMSTEECECRSRNAMQIYVNNGQPNLEVAGTGGLDVFTLSANTTNDGEWHHIAYSYDASSQTFAAYLDGAPAGGTLTTNQDIGTFAPDGNLQIGINRLGSTHFNGEISDVRIWDDIRTSTEIADNYTSRLNGAEADLAAYYRLDQDGADSTANGNDGTLTGTTLVYPSASPMPIPFARAMSFDGADDNIEITDTTAYDPGIGSMTVESWFYWDGTTPASDQFLISKGHNSADSEGFAIYMRPSNDTLTVRLNTDGTTATTSKAGQQFDLGSLDIGWHHVAMTIDQTNGQVTGYLDGSNAGWTADGTFGDTFTPDEIIGTHRFKIASDPGGNNRFEGSLADVRVWNDVRSVNEIRDGMTGYVDGNTPNLVGNWRLNDDLGAATAGDTIIDSTGNNNGSVVGNPQFVDGAAPVYSYEFSTGEDIAVHGSLFASDAETDASELTFTMAQGAGHGTVSIDSDGEFIYTPHENYAGADSFRVRVSDGAASVTRTISVTVNAVNDAPKYSVHRRHLARCSSTASTTTSRSITPTI